MMMEREIYFLGLDLGPSSVKGIMRSLSGLTVKAKRGYVGCEPISWLCAVKELISELKANADGEIAAISISSQVGTYIVDGKDVISWRSSVGREELD